MPTPINKRGIKFDATINLGHILTFIGFLVAGFAAWQTLDKRVLILEQASTIQQLRDKNQDETSIEFKSNIANSLIEIKHSIERVSDKLDAKESKKQL